MLITLNIPKSLYDQLKKSASRDRSTVSELILRQLGVELHRASKERGKRIASPIIKTKRPGTLNIDNDKIFRVIPFP